VLVLPTGAPTANDIKVLPSQTSAKAISGRKGQFRSSQRRAATEAAAAETTTNTTEEVE